MSDNKLWLVVRQDTIIQNTGYIVHAKDADEADKLVSSGMYMEETATTTMDTIQSETIDAVEINEYYRGK